MPKDRKQTYSDRQSQAARDQKQAKAKTPPEESSPTAGEAPQKASSKNRKGK